MNCSSNEKAKDFYISHNQITSHLPVFNKTHLLYKSLVFVRLWLCVCLLVDLVGFFDEDGGFNSIYIFPFCKLCFDPLSHSVGTTFLNPRVSQLFLDGLRVDIRLSL